jgi:hypothetical protein
MPTQLRFHAVGDWPRQRVAVKWIADSRPRIAEIDAAIERAWIDAHRPGVKLFDGAMCRLESLDSGPILQLAVSPTSYKIFIGTNVANPALADQFGWAALANAIGLSSALHTPDGYLMFGRRNASVAYYPNRIHPFAGTLEPRKPLDLFAEIERELAEEIAFTSADIASSSCIGMAEDVSLRQPELVFAIESHRTRKEIESKLDAEEHFDCAAVASNRSEIESALGDPAFTPIAVATLLLWGRLHFGDKWFDEARQPVTLAE